MKKNKEGEDINVVIYHSIVKPILDCQKNRAFKLLKTGIKETILQCMAQLIILIVILIVTNKAQEMKVWKKISTMTLIFSFQIIYRW
jgi:hypothetical protein